MFLALRDIRFAKGRFALMGAVVALISLLLVLLSGLTAGLGNQSTSAITKLGSSAGTPTDQLVFGAPGKNQPTISFTESQVSQQQLDSWRKSDDVASAVPLGISQGRLQAAGASQGTANVAIFGVGDGNLKNGGSSDGNSNDGNSNDGGSKDVGVEAGLSPLTIPAGGAVLGESIAEDLGLSVGESISLSGSELKISGIVPDQWYSHTSVVWTSLADWKSMARLSDPSQIATVIAVNFAENSAADVDSLNASAGTISASRNGALQGLGGYKSENGSLLMMQGFLYGISALVIVAFLTVWTVQRTRDIAVLKALGASGKYLLRDAMTQAAIVLVAGAVIGGAIGIVGGFFAEKVAPFIVSPATTLLPLLGIVLLGLAGAVLAVRKVTKVDALIALGGN